jgi:hypothetical protein
MLCNEYACCQLQQVISRGDGQCRRRKCTGFPWTVASPFDWPMC